MLDPSVGVGSWVTALQIFEWGSESLVDIEVDVRVGPPPARACCVVSADRILGARDVTSAHATMVAAVDMESAALARVSARHGLPLMVLRLVSDTPGDPLPAFLSPLAHAMAANDVRSRVTHAVRGLGQGLVDLRGVVRVMRAGHEWTHRLAEGWRSFAVKLAAEES